MQPEAFTPRFITTDHGCRVRQTCGVSPGRFLQARVPAAVRSRCALVLTMPCGKAQLPGFFTEFKGYEQGTRGRALRHMASRWGGHELSPPWQ